MSTTAETNLWKWLYKQFKKIPDLDWQRVENGVGSGTPDLEVCYRGVGFWVELKVAEERKTKGMCHVKYRPLQVPWLERRTSKGGRAYALIQHGRDRYLIPGSHARQTSGTVAVATLADLSIVPPSCKAQDILTACIEREF